MQLTLKGTLVNWGGNFDQYMQTRTECEKNQLTKWKKEQDDTKHLQEFIRSCGTYSNLRIQAGSKQKIVDKIVDAGLTENPVPDPTYQPAFPDSEKVSLPVMAFPTRARRRTTSTRAWSSAWTWTPESRWSARAERASPRSSSSCCSRSSPRSAR